MVATAATNHRPSTQSATNNRMAKAEKDDQKASPRRDEKPNAILEASPELRNTVAAIEKQFGEGAIMPWSATSCCRSKAFPQAAYRSISR